MQCPVEINLTESSRQEEQWTCKVFLSKKYIFDGVQRNVGATRNRPLGPWMPQDTEDQHFATTYDKNSVQEIIYWAQLAILNPSSTCNEYKPGRNSATPKTMQVKFSPNVVRLDVSPRHILFRIRFKLTTVDIWSRFARSILLRLAWSDQRHGVCE